MRMTYYFYVFASLLVPALGFAAWTGITEAESHLTAGLIASVLAVGTHSLLLIFMIVIIILIFLIVIIIILIFLSR